MPVEKIPIIRSCSLREDSAAIKMLDEIYASPFIRYQKISIDYPDTIKSQLNWRYDDWKGLILRQPGFDSVTIENQLREKPVIILNSTRKSEFPITKKPNDEEKFIIAYIIFSKDKSQLIIQDMTYCGEDCGTGRIALYQKIGTRWYFKKELIGWVS